MFILFASSMTVKGGNHIGTAALFKIKPSDAFFLVKWDGNTFFERNAARSQNNSHKWKISGALQ